MKRTICNPKQQRQFYSNPEIQDKIGKFLFPNQYSHLSVDFDILRKHGPEIAVFFAYLRWQQMMLKEEGMISQDGGFPLKYAQITKDLLLKEYTIRKLKKALIEEGAIATKKRGIPPVEYYWMLKGDF